MQSIFTVDQFWSDRVPAAAELKSFDYYLEASGSPKKLSLYEILQLDKSFFENYNEAEFKKHVKKLQFKFHPDTNLDNKNNANTVWTMIFPAIEKMRNPKTRNYFLSGNDLESITFNYSSDSNLKDWLREKGNALEELERELNSLLAQRPEGGFSLVPQVTFQALVKTLHENTWLSSKELAGRFYKILPRLKGLAETGQDFYALLELVLKDHITSARFRHAMVAAAASRGHWISMRITTGMALSGLFKDKEASIIWALNCIRYMEEVVLPYLRASKDIQDKKDLIELTEGLDRARKRIDGLNGEYGQGKKIPEQGINEFNELVASIIPKVEKTEDEADFLLSNEIFSIVGNNPKVEDKQTLEQLKSLFEPVERAAAKRRATAQKVDNIFANAREQLKELNSQLSTLNAELQKKNKPGNRYVAVAEKSEALYLKLNPAIIDFIDSSGQQNKETLRRLIETCSTAMQDPETQKAFKEQRGSLLIRGIIGVIRGIVGILGMILLIPLFTSWKTYKETFFTEPDTTSYKKLTAMQEQLASLSQILDQIEGVEQAQETPDQPGLL